MTAFRRSGSFVAFSFNGRVADPTRPAFSEALAQRRFRSIETAASEELSAGWVTPTDPTGNEFLLEELDAGSATWLRIRVDAKKMPKAVLARHIAAAEKERGKRLSGRERRELKDDLADKILPRVIPTTTNLDALLFHGQSRVLLFAGGKSARDTFGKLFFESFGVPLERLGPAELAAVHVDAAAIAKLEPTRWGRAS
jgi:DNA recombination-dependent growth factor C